MRFSSRQTKGGYFIYMVESEIAGKFFNQQQHHHSFAVAVSHGHPEQTSHSNHDNTKHEHHSETTSGKGDKTRDEN
jgi:hypothetical protein